jgi:hypothetical protein
MSDGTAYPKLQFTMSDGTTYPKLQLTMSDGTTYPNYNSQCQMIVIWISCAILQFEL